MNTKTLTVRIPGKHQARGARPERREREPGELCAGRLKVDLRRRRRRGKKRGLRKKKRINTIPPRLVNYHKRGQSGHCATARPETQQAAKKVLRLAFEIIDEPTQPQCSIMPSGDDTRTQITLHVDAGVQTAKLVAPLGCRQKR